MPANNKSPALLKECRRIIGNEVRRMKRLRELEAKDVANIKGLVEALVNITKTERNILADDQEAVKSLSDQQIKLLLDAEVSRPKPTPPKRLSERKIDSDED